MKKHSCSLSILFCIFLSTPLFAQFPALVSKVEKAVFQIETYDEFGLNIGSGTGFFIDSKGIGLTAYHVLRESKFAFIKDFKGNTYRIKSITRVHKESDLAEFIVESAKEPFSYLSLSNSLPLKGSDVFTIGFPEGFDRVVSKGILSATQVTKGVSEIQTTAAISEGSSGSPLLNMQGQVIGVMSYSYRNGQNMNFAYSVGNRIKMNSDAAIDLMPDVNGSFYFMDQTCKTDPNLNLTSIEYTDSTTVFNFIFSNISIAFGDGAFIYCTTENRNQTFHINDRAALNRVYLENTSLPGTIEEAPGMKTGNVKTFKLFFRRMDKLTTFDLKEGMPGGDWSFNEIRMPEKQKITKALLDDFTDRNLYPVTFDIKAEQYESALEALQEWRDSFPANERVERLSAVAYYKNGAYAASAASIERALVFLPDHGPLYADLHEVYLKQANPEKALEAIEKAITLESDCPEYYLNRADVHFTMGHWENAIADYNRFIDFGKQCTGDIYLSRGISKAKIKDSSACADIDRAKEMAESDREWDTYQKAYREFCK